MLVTILAVISCCLISSASVWADGKNYGAIIDCGSSGSRAHIFEWDSNLEYSDRLKNFRKSVDEKGEILTDIRKPGLSSCDPELAGKCMDDIFKFVAKSIPEESHKDTAIFVLATAGMRLLDKDVQEKILDDVLNHLEENYNFGRAEAKVISGADEGIYQWMTLNYLKGNYMDSKSPSTESIGLVEMGGASLQVTYPLNTSDRNSLPSKLKSTFKNLIYSPTLGQKAQKDDTKLFSASFLGFGSNSLREIYQDLLLSGSRPREWIQKNLDFSKPDKKRRSVKIDDPCLPVGAEDSVRKSFVLMRDDSKTIGFKREPDREQSFRVRLFGTGDYEKCKEYVRKLFLRAKKEETNCEDKNSCPMDLLFEKYLPFKKLKLFGLNDFYYTTNIMLNSAGKYNSKSVTDKTKQICSTPYDKLMEDFKDANKYDATRVLYECFKAIAVDTFLHEAMRAPENYEGFETVGNIKEQKIDWALGAMIARLNVFDEETTDEKTAEPKMKFKNSLKRVFKFKSWTHIMK